MEIIESIFKDCKIKISQTNFSILSRENNEFVQIGQTYNFQEAISESKLEPIGESILTEISFLLYTNQSINNTCQRLAQLY